MEDDAHVVLDQHDGVAAVAMQAPDQLRDLVGLLVAHAGGRLVEQQQMRLQRQRHRDLGGALVAMRELADQPVGLVLQRDQLQRLLDMLMDLGRLGAADPGAQAIAARDFGRDADVLEHRQLRERSR